MIASSTYRVPDHTSRSSNQRIAGRLEASIAYHLQHPERIDARLAELDREWDVERALETGSAILSLGGLGLSQARDRRWLALTFAVQAFFLQHALQGWCPPLPIFRALGFRTPREIDQERYALKILRGDFGPLPSAESRPRQLAESVR